MWFRYLFSFLFFIKYPETLPFLSGILLSLPSAYWLVVNVQSEPTK